MANGTSSSPSFSRGRKWSIGFNVVLTVLAVLAVMVMVNYLCGRYFNRRFHVSLKQKLELSPRTLSVLQSLTNQVEVTLYFDRKNYLYDTLLDLLKEYQTHSRSKLSVRLVDYNHENGLAQEVSTKYNLGSATNLIIFASAGHPAQILPEAMFMETRLVPAPGDDPRVPEYRRQPIAFRGEVNFTWALLAVSSPNPLKAYYLLGHREHDPTDASKSGYNSFLSVVQQNYIDVVALPLIGTNGVPADCNLLIVAAPSDALQPYEVEQIDRYLNEGGRMLALFNFATTNKEIGLEKVLAHWGVNVSDSVVIDPQWTSPEAPGNDVQAHFFTTHPAVNPLMGGVVQFYMPRMVSRVELQLSPTDGRKAEEIIYTGPKAYRVNDPTRASTNLPLAVAVESTVARERGSTRILVVGDSFFLINQLIKVGANRDFANFAINWLTQKDFLMQIGPQPVAEYRLLVAESQMRAARLLLLAAMPGGVLLFGGLVWLRRRK